MVVCHWDHFPVRMRGFPHFSFTHSITPGLAEPAEVAGQLRCWAKPGWTSRWRQQDDARASAGEGTALTFAPCRQGKGLTGERTRGWERDSLRSRLLLTPSYFARLTKPVSPSFARYVLISPANPAADVPSETGAPSERFACKGRSR